MTRLSLLLALLLAVSGPQGRPEADGVAQGQGLDASAVSHGSPWSWGHSASTASPGQAEPARAFAESTALVSGFATWYAWMPGQAAAGPALRRSLGPGWRGATVRVCSLHQCVVVRLTDWCLCPGGHIVDLDSRSFVRLAPLSQGIVRVSVSRAGVSVAPRPNPTAPATDWVP